MLDIERLRLGVRILDFQHARLISLADRLDRDAVDAVTAIGELRRYVEEHFLVEEELMAAYGCPDAAAHIAAHDLFRQRVLAVDPQSVGTSRALLTSLRQFVERWIEEHILHTDRRLAECIRAAGV